MKIYYYQCNKTKAIKLSTILLPALLCEETYYLIGSSLIDPPKERIETVLVNRYSLSSLDLPENAYDIKVSFKIKE